METKQPIIRARSEHNISRRDIDPDALKVLYRLVRRGHVAYLVGGGVRDLLLGRQPKDFDVSTDARPNDLKRLFRNCFLIGRRFRLAHIKYGDKVIETSTFRCQPQNVEGEDLLQLEDNTFGTPEQDALRRDFTINGLFYDVETFSVLDYVGGLEDLEKRVVRAIGDASIRFREDPVRMIRAIRFASRLGFAIEDVTFHALLECREEIRKASVPRLLEELYRLYAFGSANRAFRLLRQTRILDVMLPEVAAYLDETDQSGDSPLWNYLEALDRGDLVIPQATNALMLGALFLPMILHKADKPDSALTQKQLADAYEAVVAPIIELLRVPRRVQDTLMRILTSQHRFFSKPRKGFSKAKFAAQDCFPEALALYELHLTATGKDFARADEWRVLWEGLMDEAEALPVTAGAAEEEGGKRDSRRRRRRRRKDRYPDDGTNSARADGTDAGNEDEDDTAGEAAHPALPSHVEPVASGRVSLVSPTHAGRKPTSAAGTGEEPEADGEEEDDVDAPAGASETAGQEETTAASGDAGQATDGTGGEPMTRSKRRRRRRKKRSGAPTDGSAIAGPAESGAAGAAGATGATGNAGTAAADDSPVAGAAIPESSARSSDAGASATEGTARAKEGERRKPFPRRERNEGEGRDAGRAEQAERHAGGDESDPELAKLTDAPLTAFGVIKQVQSGKKDHKKKHRRGDKDKQIIHDYRPADAGPTYDRGSEAPHWLDEI